MIRYVLAVELMPVSLGTRGVTIDLGFEMAASKKEQRGVLREFVKLYFCVENADGFGSRMQSILAANPDPADSRAVRIPFGIFPVDPFCNPI